MNTKTAIVAVAASLVAGLHAEVFTLASPDGKNVIEFTVGEKVSYQIFHDGKTLTDLTPIALEIEGMELSTELAGSATSFRDENIETPVYKKSRITGRTNFLRLDFKGGWAVEAAARDEGVAYRFATAFGGEITVNNELAPLCFPKAGQRVLACTDWACFDPNDRFQNSWEGICKEYDVADAFKSAKDGLWYCPLTFLYECGLAMCVTESDLRDYPGWNMLAGGDGKSLKAVFAGCPTDLRFLDMSGRECGGDHGFLQRCYGRAGYIAKTAGTRTFPWRCFIIAQEPSKLAENDLVYVLAAEPEEGADFSWVRPGKVAWDWWNNWNLKGVDFRTGINTETYEYYIDFASRNGLEYVIFDLGWNDGMDMMTTIPEMDVPHLISYARERGVGIVLWATCAQFMGHEEEIMEYYSKLGAAGFKTDYMDSNDQHMVAYLEKLSALAAKYRMIMDYHGMFKPTGLQRRYPNVLNFEGVHGLEQLKFTDETYMPDHDANLVYSRLAAGPMDYTMGAMKNFRRDAWRRNHDSPGSLGTRCHQIALMGVIEAPFQMLCDSPSLYLENMECTRFMSKVPVVWDDTKALFGTPGKNIGIARKSKDEWYASAIGNWDVQKIEIDTSLFLEGGEWETEIFADGVNADRYPEDYRRTTGKIRAGEKIEATLMPGGGWIARFRKIPDEFPLSIKDIQCRDPYVVVDRAAGRYLLFTTYYVPQGTPGADYFGMTGDGVRVYESKDLENWSEPRQVLDVPYELLGTSAVWAPEVHFHNGNWYVFTTLNYPNNTRGTWTFVSDDLRGPYRMMEPHSVTPVDWCSLDGTLYVEDGKPYMVFCHEWQQIVDGDVSYVGLSPDLSKAVGEPVKLFNQSEAPGVRSDVRVTDGPYLHRSKSGNLWMLWSSGLENGSYCTFKVKSESGKLAGPWKNHELLFSADGGHAMVFEDLDGVLRLSLHSPNPPPNERPLFLPVDDELNPIGW